MFFFFNPTMVFIWIGVKLMGPEGIWGPTCPKTDGAHRRCSPKENHRYKYRDISFVSGFMFCFFFFYR